MSLTKLSKDKFSLNQANNLARVLGLAERVMSCPAKDGRHVPGALGMRHSPATATAMPMVMVVVAHVVARPVLGAGRYCLAVVVVDATAANVAAAAAGAATSATPVVVDDVAGRVQRRLAGVVQPVQGVLLLGGRLFEMNSKKYVKLFPFWSKTKMKQFIVLFVCLFACF